MQKHIKNNSGMFIPFSLSLKLLITFWHLEIL